MKAALTRLRNEAAQMVCDKPMLVQLREWAWKSLFVRPWRMLIRVMR